MLKHGAIVIIVAIVLLLSGCEESSQQEKREHTLQHLLDTYSLDKDIKNPGVPIWEHWVRTSGELPPDFDEVLASMAPRPVFISAPKWDQNIIFSDVEEYINQGRQIYKLYDAGQKLDYYTPDGFTRFTIDQQNKIIDWVEQQVDSVL